MNNLEAAGLLKVQEASRAFSAIKQSLRLCNQEVDEKNPTDISYCYSGYAPLSVRLVEHVVKHNGWSGIEEVIVTLEFFVLSTPAIILVYSLCYLMCKQHIIASSDFCD